VFGSQVKLETGQTVVADESYVRESILTPQMKIVQGYQPLMPTFQGLINEDGVMSLIEYVKTLPSDQVPGAQQANAAAPAGRGEERK
jgi:cytochrome c oxidase subunit 2